ncbi:MAG: anaerobic selenocysteine-containing dehydrogenase, partial [bacterium]
SVQWHTQTRTRNSAVLQKLAAKDIYVEIHPHDAKEIGISANSWVAVESPRGKIKARAMISNKMQIGQIFIPMHYVEVNQLTHPSFDKYSFQPSYKTCSARVLKK